MIQGIPCAAGTTQGLSTVHAHARMVRVEVDNPLPQRPPRCATLSGRPRLRVALIVTVTDRKPGKRGRNKKSPSGKPDSGV